MNSRMPYLQQFYCSMSQEPTLEAGDILRIPSDERVARNDGQAKRSSLAKDILESIGIILEVGTYSL